jgi:hypothetical protein
MEVESPVSELPPPLVTLTVWDAGFPPPCCAVKPMDKADKLIIAGGLPIENRTETVCGLFPAVGELTDRVAPCTPVVSDPVTACNVIVAGAVELFNVAVSHPEPEP